MKLHNMSNKLASNLGYTALLGLLVLFGAVSTAEARTTPCGQYDPSFGYYGQCDANNNPIAGTTTNTGGTNTNTGGTNTNTGNTNTTNVQTSPTAVYYTNQAGIEATQQLPTVGCNQYDTRQGGYVICDGTGKPTSYWITSQNSGGGDANITVNYSNNPQSNTQSPSYSGNNNAYGTYNAANNYGYTSYPTYGGYGSYSGYGNSYGSSYGNTSGGSSWGNLALGLFSSLLSSNSSYGSYGGYSSYPSYGGYGNYSSYYPSYTTSYQPVRNYSYTTTDYGIRAVNPYSSGGYDWDSDVSNPYSSGGYDWE